MEEVGSGTNKVVKWCREWGLPDPIFEYATGTSIVVTLKKAISVDNKKEEKAREKTREKILNLMEENPTVTVHELSKSLNITHKGVEWNIDKMKKEGFISRIGPDKGGHWKVLKGKKAGKRLTVKG